MPDFGIPEAAIIASAALSAGSTAYSLSKGSGSPPPITPPPPPPPAPPPPAVAPPPPTETDAEAPVAAAKKRRQTAFGVDQTLLVSPLGGAGTGTTGRASIGG